MSTARTEIDLAPVREAPAAEGVVALVVARPSEGRRELLEQGRLEPGGGLLGDGWAERPSSSSADGGPNPEAEVTVMGSRAIALIAADGGAARWAEAGDQLFVDLDLSESNLPAGTRIQVGEAVLEVSSHPHLGCGKFARRFGVEALKLVNSAEGRELRLRGLNARVIDAGDVRPGDPARKLTAGS